MNNTFTFFSTISEPLFSSTFRPIIEPILSDETSLPELRDLAHDDFNDFLSEIFKLAASYYSFLYITSSITGEIFAALPLDSIINTPASEVFSNLNTYNIIPAITPPASINPEKITLTLS